MISRDDWLKALEEASTPPPQDPDVLTLKELAAVLGHQLAHTSRIARRLVEAGKAIQTTKLVRMNSGGWRSVPAYKLVKDEQAPV